MTDPRRARATRIVRILLITILIVLALRLLAWRSPVYAPLARPIYLLVLLTAAWRIWHVARRHGADRRHETRRR